MPKDQRKDLRRLNAEELTNEVAESTQAVLDLRFQLATRQLKDVHALKRARSRMARALTITRQREIESA